MVCDRLSRDQNRWMQHLKKIATSSANLQQSSVMRRLSSVIGWRRCVTLRLSRGLLCGINTGGELTAISYQGRKLSGVLASTVLERNFFLRPCLLQPVYIPDTTNLWYLSTTEHVAAELYFCTVFVKKRKKRQPRWSPRCVRTTTATARPPSTGWSTWSCLPPTVTLLWWEKQL